MRRIIIAFLLLFLAACSGKVAVSETPNSPAPSLSNVYPNSSTLFGSVRARLKTSVPVRLPASVPVLEGVANPTPYVVEATPDRYTVVLQSDPSCEGAIACSPVTIIGERLSKNPPSIASEYAYMLSNPDYKPIERSPDEPGEIVLSGNKTGYFVPWVLGASYSDAKIVWDEGSYRYSVGITKGRKEDVLVMANSVK